MSTSLYKGGIHPSEYILPTDNGNNSASYTRDALTAGGSVSCSRLDSYLKAQEMVGQYDATKIHTIKNFSATEMSVFNRYGWLYPDDEMDVTQSYVFIVRPDLNILTPDNDFVKLNTQAARNPYFQYLNMTDPTLLLNLTQQVNADKTSHHFIPFLVDRVEAYHVPDYEIKINELSQPFTNFKTNYAGNANDSQSGSQFTITFREANGLRVLKLFHAWIEYMNCLSRGTFDPYDVYKYSKFESGALMLDYATSVYFMRVKPNMEIVYFHKQTGVFPKAAPHSNMSYNRGSQPGNTLDIEFVGGYPEVLSPYSMADFNFNSNVTDVQKIINSSASNYGYDLGANYTGGSWGTPLVGSPYIIQSSPSLGKRSKYYLGWLQAGT